MRQQNTNEIAGLRPEDEGQPPLSVPRLRGDAPEGAEEAAPHPPRDALGYHRPAFGRDPIGELDNDLTRQHAGEPLGERISVTGRVLEDDGRPVRGSLIEIWQANVAGRYTHHLITAPGSLASSPRTSVNGRRDRGIREHPGRADIT